MNDKIKDSVNVRVCTVSDNSDNSTTNKDIKVVINLSQALPIISLSQSVGPGIKGIDKTVPSDINYNCGARSELNVPYDDGYMYNHLQDFAIDSTPTLPGDLVDPDAVFVEDRFIHIAKITSIVRRMEMEIYYDKKYKDVFLIPTLQFMGADETSKKQFEGTTSFIEGYKIGVDGSPYELDANLIMVNNHGSVTFPEPLVTNMETKTHLLQFLGSRTNPSNNYGIMLGADYLESRGGVPSEFVSLGSSETLFGSPVVAHKAMSTTVGAFALIPIGGKVLSDILIPLP